MQLDIHQVMDNPNTLIRIDIGQDEAIKAFMVQDTFAIQASAQYEPEYKLSAGEAVNKWIKLGTSTIGSSQQKLEGIDTSVLSWIDCTRPVFNLELLFLGTKKTPDPRKDPVKLLTGVVPYSAERGMIEAPWQYKLSSSSSQSAKGTMTIEIGKWFRARKQVLIDCQIECSKEVTNQSGYPLYATAMIQFTPTHLLTKKDIVDYFPGLN